MDWMAELNATVELDSWFEIQAYEAKELRDFILEKDAEIERLREHNKKMANVITDYCNEFIEEAPFYDEFWNALQQKESE